MKDGYYRVDDKEDIINVRNGMYVFIMIDGRTEGLSKNWKTFPSNHKPHNLYPLSDEDVFTEMV